MRNRGMTRTRYLLLGLLFVLVLVPLSLLYDSRNGLAQAQHSSRGHGHLPPPGPSVPSCEGPAGPGKAVCHAKVRTDVDTDSAGNPIGQSSTPSPAVDTGPYGSGWLACKRRTIPLRARPVRG